MKYIKKRNRYEAPNVTFLKDNMEAFSYDWWQFVKIIDGKVVFNNYSYSQATNKHQRKVRNLMSDLDIKIDYFVESACGLQSIDWFDNAKEILKENIESIEKSLASPKRKKKLDEERKEMIAFYKKEIENLYLLEYGSVTYGLLVETH